MFNLYDPQLMSLLLHEIKRFGPKFTLGNLSVPMVSFRNTLGRLILQRSLVDLFCGLISLSIL